MSRNSEEMPDHIRHPKKWKYFAGATLAIVILTPLWFLFDILVLHPNIQQETAMDRLRWLGVSAAVVALVFAWNWLANAESSRIRERDWRQDMEALKKQEAALHTGKAQREYVLEVIGLGVTVEKYRQSALWNILQKGSAHTSIREPDPKKYPWSGTDKDGVGGGRSCDALENGANFSPMYWGVPSFYASAPMIKPYRVLADTRPIAGLAESAVGTGMAWHLFVTAPSKLAERPDRLLEKVFAFFDEYPDLPYVVLLTVDSMGIRELHSALDSPELLKDGYYIPEMPDASAVFVLARRERVEPLRPYVWDDPDNDFVQENLRRMYSDLMDTVPTPERPTEPGRVHMGRQPTVDEWLPAAAAFAKAPRAAIYKSGSVLASFNRWKNDPPKDWKPSPWFPIPWNSAQMETFDKMPSLGFIHRPTFVKFVDEHGKPITRRDQRQKTLEAGWQQALQSLPEAERVKGPARIVAATGNQAEQLLALEGTLHRYAEQGGPEIDSGKLTQFINTDRRLGNTGAATFFVQMALGVMGSYRAGGVSAAINLRDPAEASIIFISPPAPDKRKEQGGDEFDVFSHKVEPAIDPENYKAPSVEALAAGLAK